MHERLDAERGSGDVAGVRELHGHAAQASMTLMSSSAESGP
jgi:hypothetical protein